MAKKLESIGVRKYKNGFQLTLHPDELKKPYHWKNPREIFVSSMSDLFHIILSLYDYFFIGALCHEFLIKFKY
jgi:protein gp37